MRMLYKTAGTLACSLTLSTHNRNREDLYCLLFSILCSRTYIYTLYYCIYCACTLQVSFARRTGVTMRELQSCRTNEQLERAAQNASALALAAASPTRAPSATATTAAATGAATAAGTGAAAAAGAGVSEDSLRYSSTGSSQYMSQPTQGSFKARYLGDYSGQQLSSLRGASLVTSGMCTCTNIMFAYTGQLMH
jgi:hypothetical protein